MDPVAVSDVVAGMMAPRARTQLGEDVSRGLVTAVVDRLGKLFGYNPRFLDALEQCQHDGSPAAVADSEAALRWYAERDVALAAELPRWTDKTKTRLAGMSQQVRAGRMSDQSHGRK